MKSDSQDIIDMFIEAIYSNKRLSDLLILKGGQLLTLYEISDRASYDIDFSITRSMEKQFEELTPLLKETLKDHFDRNGLLVFDYNFTSKPRKRNVYLPPYWGGYALEFKVINKELKEKLSIEEMRRSALVLGKNQSTKMQIDFSYHEYSEDPYEIKVEGSDIKIKAYRPIIVVYEKIRALCQHLPGDHLPKNKRGRARDLYDIYKFVFSENKYSLEEEEIYSKDNVHELKEVFKAKEVPLELLLQLDLNYEKLKQDYKDTLELTVPEVERIGFEYLFEFTKELMEKIHFNLL